MSRLSQLASRLIVSEKDSNSTGKILINEDIPHLEFPMLDTPVAAVDFDGTLAEYDGWRGSSVVGKPRAYAIWALTCFKHNNWEVEIHTVRGELDALWAWVDKYADGLVSRINETKEGLLVHEGVKSQLSKKPAVDIFIDDRSDYWFGRNLDWIEIMDRLSQRKVFPNGLLPRVEHLEDK